MNRLLRGPIAGVAAIAAMLLLATAAWADPGGKGGGDGGGKGALVVPTYCSIALPGIGTAEGPGLVLLLPNGGQTIHCTASLLAGASPPSKAVRIEAGGCITIVTPSGIVVGTCRR